MIHSWPGTSASPAIHSAVTLAAQLTPAHWTEDAACRWMTPAEADLAFFSPGPLSAATAELCSLCPVRAECESAGVGEEGRWGGRSQNGLGGGVQGVA